jgi:hypothetical protein
VSVKSKQPKFEDENENEEEEEEHSTLNPSSETG